MGYAGLKVLRADMGGIVAGTWPRMGDGLIRVFVEEWVGSDLLRYIKLHELGHYFAGDLSEPIAFNFTGPLPEAEPVADVFALYGLLDEFEREREPGWLADRLRELVPVADYGWTNHRAQWLAEFLFEMEE